MHNAQMGSGEGRTSMGAPSAVNSSMSRSLANTAYMALGGIFGLIVALVIVSLYKNGSP